MQGGLCEALREEGGKRVQSISWLPSTQKPSFQHPSDQWQLGPKGLPGPAPLSPHRPPFLTSLFSASSLLDTEGGSHIWGVYLCSEHPPQDSVPTSPLNTRPQNLRARPVQSPQSEGPGQTITVRNVTFQTPPSFCWIGTSEVVVGEGQYSALHQVFQYVLITPTILQTLCPSGTTSSHFYRWEMKV